MEIMNFDTPEQMRAHLQHAIHHRLHPEQLRLGPDSYWAQFVNIAAREVRFGRVLTHLDIVNMATEQGATRAGAIGIANRALASCQHDHLMYSVWSDRRRAEQLAAVPKAHVWPIEPRLADEAAHAEFQIEQLADWAKVLLDVAFRSHRAHVRSLTTRTEN